MTRPFYWSVRRELWENRSLYLAPFIVGGFVLFATIVNAMRLPILLPRLMTADSMKQRVTFTQPFSGIAGSLIFTAFLVAAFYCLEAFQSERRDRSILFWKSLPVSDRTTVLAKAAIPLVLMPLLVIAIVITAQLALLLMSSLMLINNPSGLSLFLSHVKYVQMTIAFVYGVIAMVLWHAPLYCWFLLVSAWARRVAILWAVLPFLAIGAVERIVFGTTLFMKMLGARVTGVIHLAYVFPPKGTRVAVDPFDHMTPGRFLSAPGLWLGLLFAAACVVVAIRLRHRREPL